MEVKRSQLDNAPIIHGADTNEGLDLHKYGFRLLNRKGWQLNKAVTNAAGSSTSWSISFDSMDQVRKVARRLSDKARALQGSEATETHETVARMAQQVITFVQTQELPDLPAGFVVLDDARTADYHPDGSNRIG
jgi:hypothetical protein